VELELSFIAAVRTFNHICSPVWRSLEVGLYSLPFIGIVINVDSCLSNNVLGIAGNGKCYAETIDG